VVRARTAFLLDPHPTHDGGTVMNGAAAVPIGLHPAHDGETVMNWAPAWQRLGEGVGDELWDFGGCGVFGYGGVGEVVGAGVGRCMGGGGAYRSLAGAFDPEAGVDVGEDGVA